MPRLPFWLEVVTDSDEVAVVVPCGFSILAVQSGWVSQWPPCACEKATRPCRPMTYVPSGSEPATELFPLQL